MAKVRVETGGKRGRREREQEEERKGGKERREQWTVQYMWLANLVFFFFVNR